MEAPRRAWLMAAVKLVGGATVGAATGRILSPFAVAAARYICTTEEQRERSRQEAGNLRPESDSETHTRGFYKVAKEFPGLQLASTSVGRFKRHDGGWGSAVLLDEQTMVMCAHEIAPYYEENRIGHVIFSPLENARLGTFLFNFVWDSVHDLAFATFVDRTACAREGLTPVKMGDVAYNPPDPGQKIVCVGFPGAADGKLHATVGSPAEFIESYKILSGEIQNCHVGGDAISHPGMSGGAVLQCASDGSLSLSGIVSAGFNKRGADSFVPGVRYVPVDLIRKAYLALYPDRAREAGIKALPDTASRPMPAACDIGRRDFIALRPTQG